MDVLGCLLSFMPPIFTIQKVEYLLPSNLWSGIHLFRNSAQTLDIGVLLSLMQKNSLALMLIFQRKSSRTNGKSFLGAGWWNVPSPGSTTPDASAKILRFLFLPLRPWSLFLISTHCSNAYEYRFLHNSPKWVEVLSVAFSVSYAWSQPHLG